MQDAITRRVQQTAVSCEIEDIRHSRDVHRPCQDEGEVDQDSAASPLSCETSQLSSLVYGSGSASASGRALLFFLTFTSRQPASGSHASAARSRTSHSNCPASSIARDFDNFALRHRESSNSSHHDRLSPHCAQRPSATTTAQRPSPDSRRFATSSLRSNTPIARLQSKALIIDESHYLDTACHLDS